MLESRDNPPKAHDLQPMPCPKCGANLTLAHIEPDQPGYDRRTFECRDIARDYERLAKRAEERAAKLPPQSK